MSPPAASSGQFDQPHLLDEIKKAISQMNSDRASGMDGILTEVYEAAGLNGLEACYDIFSSIWDEEEMPEDSNDTIINAL